MIIVTIRILMSYVCGPSSGCLQVIKVARFACHIKVGTIGRLEAFLNFICAAK